MNHTQRIIDRRDALRSIHNNLDSAWIAVYDLLDYPTIYQPIKLSRIALIRAKTERIATRIVCSLSLVLGFAVPLLIASL